MSGYQPFLISAAKTGLFNYLEPWIRPEEAFDPLENAKVYRGVLKKRFGYVQLGNTLADGNPVMGIMRFQNESSALENLVVATTRNAYLFDDGSQTFSPLTSVAASNFWQGNVSMGGSITVSTFWPNLAPNSVSITDGTSTITDNGAGSLSASGNFAAGGTVNYTTGSVTLNFTAAMTNQSFSISATSTNYFSGNIKNFFNWVDWQPTDPNTFVSSVNYLYMVNNVDPITLFNGTNLSRPIFYVNSAKTDYITKCLDVKVYENRLILVLTSLNSAANPLNQAIYWSALFNPFNFTNDLAGNGGQLSAATSDIIQSFNFLRGIGIVRFSRSVWLFRYTGNDFNPFQFSSINRTKTTNCPYASVEYDERETGIGSTGLTACDGVNLQRYDTSIIDFYETEMSEQYYAQAFSQRYDNNSETWTLYVSQESQNAIVGGVAPGSDKALVYNFLENTWGTHVFTDPMTCLGLYHVITGTTWADLTETWESQDYSWLSYSSQKSAPNLLVGDTTGHIFWIDNQAATTDNGNPISSNITSTRWNPFTKIGQKVQFGFIDFYYEREDDCVMTLNFFVDNSSTPAAVRTFTMNADGTDGNAGSDNAMKRIYINAMGEFLQMEMTTSSNSNFQINGLVLWARPAGRLTP